MQFGTIPKRSSREPLTSWRGMSVPVEELLYKKDDLADRLGT